MKLDIDQLCETLDAEYELLALQGEVSDCHVFRFRDCLLRYELTVDAVSDTITLAADPEKPIQACPLLEFSFRCIEIEIREGTYAENAGNAVRFWEHRENEGGIRLTLTPRGDGRWYIWANAWDRPSH